MIRDDRTSRREYDAQMFAYLSPIDEKLIQQKSLQETKKKKPKKIK